MGVLEPELELEEEDELEEMPELEVVELEVVVLEVVVLEGLVLVDLKLALQPIGRQAQIAGSKASQGGGQVILQVHELF